MLMSLNANELKEKSQASVFAMIVEMAERDEVLIDARSNHDSEDRTIEDCDYEIEMGSFNQRPGNDIYIRFPKNEEYIEIHSVITLRQEVAELIEKCTGEISTGFYRDLRRISAQAGLFPKLIVDVDSFIILGWTRLYVEDCSRSRVFQVCLRASMGLQMVRDHVRGTIGLPEEFGIDALND